MMNPRAVYRENDVRGASSIRLVILLYDQLIQDLVQAARAIEESDIELRSKMLNHAILVIAHLQSALDFTAGGQETCGLGLEGFGREVVSRGQNGFAFGVFCRSSHVGPYCQ